jgi:hypothetical protein
MPPHPARAESGERRVGGLRVGSVRKFGRKHIITKTAKYAGSWIGQQSRRRWTGSLAGLAYTPSEHWRVRGCCQKILSMVILNWARNGGLREGGKWWKMLGVIPMGSGPQWIKDWKCTKYPCMVQIMWRSDIYWNRWQIWIRKSRSKITISEVAHPNI